MRVRTYLFGETDRGSAENANGSDTMNGANEISQKERRRKEPIIKGKCAATQ